MCALGKKHRDALKILGSRSDRDVDKISEAGLTPIPSTRIAAPGLAEAQLIMELRKIYWDDLEPGHFLDPSIEKNYPDRDYHRMYFGEILAITGTGSYSII